MASVIKNSQILEADEKDVDVELTAPTRLIGTHPNVVPLFNNAQSPRLFYAARFVNQAMPLANRETPLVQSLDPETGESFEHEFGRRVGAKYFDDDDEGDVVSVSPDEIKIKLRNGQTKSVDLYNNFQFNRKTQLSNRPIVKPGDHVKKGDILAASNFTDDNGTLSMGVNARVALVPYKGYSMDDAIVVSQSFAQKMASEHSYETDVQKETDTKFGKVHYASVFPTKFTREQLDTLDDNGVVKPGTILHKGDPIILATRPQSVSSNTHLGKLGKTFRQMRTDAAEVWEHEYPGTVIDTAETKKGYKVYSAATCPLSVGDKQIFRNGQKSIVSLILPDEQMPRSLDGKPFEVLLNPLALPSRVNTATPYEFLIGKLAAATGKPYKVAGFGKAGQSRLEWVKEELAKHGLSDTEEIFDPMTGKKLEHPVLTGIGYVEKLHHVVDSKLSARGQGGYDANEQPTKGGSESAQAKRMGGLETTALMAKGAYSTLREGAVLRGQKNSDYWRMLRQGYTPAEPGAPFVWNKFLAMLNGAGLNAKDLGGGVKRLSPFTEKDLQALNPLEVQSGKLVNLNTLEPDPNGLFSPQLVAGDRWGKITLPTVLPNPAFEKQIMQILNITAADMRKVIAGEMTLKEAKANKKKS